MEIQPQAIAVLTARMFLGILFFFQGYDKVMRIKVKNVAEEFRHPAQQKNIPFSLLYFGTFLTSYIELLAGLFLIIGLFTSISLYLLCLDLILVSFAFSIIRPMWDMQYIFPRLVLLLFLLIAPAGWDVFTMDHLLHP